MYNWEAEDLMMEVGKPRCDGTYRELNGYH